MKDPQILLVDDDDADAEMASEAYRRLKRDELMGWARGGEEALKLASGRAGRELRLILLDLRMPGVDGFTVLRRLRRSEKLRLVPVVILTTSRLEKEVVECYELGASGYIVKPMNFDKLVDLLRCVCDYWIDANVCVRDVTR